MQAADRAAPQPRPTTCIVPEAVSAWLSCSRGSEHSTPLVPCPRPDQQPLSGCVGRDVPHHSWPRRCSSRWFALVAGWRNPQGIGGSPSAAASKLSFAGLNSPLKPITTRAAVPVLEVGDSMKSCTPRSRLIDRLVAFPFRRSELRSELPALSKDVEDSNHVVTERGFLVLACSQRSPFRWLARRLRNQLILARWVLPSRRGENAAWRERDEVALRSVLCGPYVSKNRFYIVTAPGCVLISHGPEFIDDWIGVRRLHGVVSRSSFGVQMIGGA